jgi:hypothetical protein
MNTGTGKQNVASQLLQYEPTLIAWLTSFVANGATIGFVNVPTWVHLVILGVSCGVLGVFNRGKVSPA